MWKDAVHKTWRAHCLEFMLLLVITMMGFYIIGLEVKFTGGFQLVHALVTGFFGVMTIVYPAVTVLKDYHDLTTNVGEHTHGEV